MPPGRLPLSGVLAREVELRLDGGALVVPGQSLLEIRDRLGGAARAVQRLPEVVEGIGVADVAAVRRPRGDGLLSGPGRPRRSRLAASARSPGRSSLPHQRCRQSPARVRQAPALPCRPAARRRAPALPTASASLPSLGLAVFSAPRWPAEPCRPSRFGPLPAARGCRPIRRASRAGRRRPRSQTASSATGIRAAALRRGPARGGGRTRRGRVCSGARTTESGSTRGRRRVGARGCAGRAGRSRPYERGRQLFRQLSGAGGTSSSGSRAIPRVSAAAAPAGAEGRR